MRAFGSQAWRGAGEDDIPSIGLRFEDCRIAVSSQDPEDLRWLSAFLGASFAPAACTSPDFRVDLVIDPDAHDTLRAAGRPGTGAMVEGFAGDEKPVLFERWPSGGSGQVFRDLRKPVFYRLSADGKRVTLLAREKMPNTLRAVMRVVRELAMGRAVATGGILLHASAVGCEPGVVVICGPRRSGKTTLLLSLLQHSAVSYVANDRCVLRVGKRGATVRGLPTIVSIRCDGLEHFPALRQKIERRRPDLRSALPDRVSLTPPELCELVDAPPAPGGPVLALVHPRVSENPRRPGFRRLSPVEALQRFREGLLRVSQPTLLGEVFSGGAGPFAARSAAEAASLVERQVAASLPSFDWSLRAGTVPGPVQCEEILARICSEAGRPRDPDRTHV